MIIVSGWLRTAATDRDGYIENCRAVVAAARATPGCVDFSISPDLLDLGRINIFEQWESIDALDTFRGSGPSDDQQTMIVDARVFQHELSSSISLT